MNKKEKILTVLLVVTCFISFSAGTVFGLNHIDYEDPDWQCTKWVGIVELAKQDYPHFIEDALRMAEKKCGFNIDSLKP